MDEVETCTVEGDIVQTDTVSRGSDTFHHTHYQELLNQSTRLLQLSLEDTNVLRSDIENQLSTWNEVKLEINIFVAGNNKIFFIRVYVFKFYFNLNS